MAERRKWPRVAWSAGGRVFFGNDEVPCSVVDVSVGGMGIVAPRVALPGTFVRIQWSAPGDEWTDVDGILVRAHKRSSAEWLWGIHLERLPPHAEARIAALVSAVPAPGTKPPSAPLHAQPEAQPRSAPSSHSAPAGRPPSGPVHRAPAATTARPLARRSGSMQRAISNQELAALFREALEAHEPQKAKKNR